MFDNDMFIETTFMRYWYGKQGIIGITLKSDTPNIWSPGQHICSRLEADISSLANSEQVMPSNDKPKEEMKARILSDCNDHRSLQGAINDYINPLEPSNY